MNTRRRWKPTKPASPPEWSDAAILRSRLKETLAQRDALVASLPARDQAVAQAAVNASAKEIAERTLAAAAEAGWLRQRPGPSVVKRLLRDEAGVVTGVVETTEETA